MRVTVTHNRDIAQVRHDVDRSFDDIFQGMPIGPVQITDEQRAWNGNTLTFSFNARAAFMALPVKGWIQVEERLITIEVDLPPFVSQFIPEQKIKTAVESRIRGLLT